VLYVSQTRKERSGIHMASNGSKNGSSPKGNRGNQRQQSDRDPPAKEIRIGLLKATIWANKKDDGKWYSVTLSRSYKDGDDQWKTSHSFGKDDLLVASQLLQQAFLWIAKESGAVGLGAGTEDEEGGDGSESRF
jgi:hypothetical protein